MNGSSLLSALNAPAVHGASGETIRIGLVGCGGRGSGAVVDALSSNSGPLTLVAMGDIFEQRLASSHAALSAKFPAEIQVPADQRFVGFDAYQKVMDCLRPGDIAIFATPPAFRWVHFDYAVRKGLHVFMEKPVTVDGPTTRRMFDLAEQSVRKNLKVGVGLMCRHCDARRELQRRVQDGELGDIVSMRAYRLQRPGGNVFVKPDPSLPEVMFQLRRFHAFLWASGGVFSDYNIHNIDECCMIKGQWPVKAQALGARHDRGDYVDQNLGIYAVEYTFPDGTTLHFDGRNLEGAHGEFASYAHGTKGFAVISANRHTPARCRIYGGQSMDESRLAWAYPPDERSPFRLEWMYLIDAIRNDRPWNEVRRGAQVSLVTSMGRMAAHTGRVVTYDQMLGSTHEFAPEVDRLTEHGPAPLVAGPDGRYPVPRPGLVTDREY
jgi:predicted dehydrogenase